MAVTSPHGGFLTLLRKRNFLRLWLAQLISMTILNASNYALLVIIEEVTGSTTLVGLAIICFSLPALLFGAPAGVFVDRMNKRRVLFNSNLLRAVATAVFVFSLIIAPKNIIPIYLLTFLVSCIGQFFTPAEGSAIPMLVSEDELMPALSLFNITFMLSQALGFILFAPLVLSLLPSFNLFNITINSVEMLYVLIAVLYIVCAVLIALIPTQSFVQRPQETRERLTTESLSVMDNVWHEIYQGWSFIRRNKQLFLAVIQLSFAGVLLLVIGELATPIVTKLLWFPAKNMAIVFAPAGIGLVAGSVVMPRIILYLGKSRAIFMGSALLAIITLVLPIFTGVTHHFEAHHWDPNPLTHPMLLFVISLLMFMAGFSLDLINIPAQTAIQEQTPDWIKGRVLALQLMFYNACSIPIILFIGGVADLFNLDKVLYLLSACEIAFGFWGLWYERRHTQTIPVEKKVEEQPEPDPIAP